MYPTCGKLFPYGIVGLTKASDYDQVRMVAESFAEYKKIFDDIGVQGQNSGEKTLEDKFFEYEVSVQFVRLERSTIWFSKLFRVVSTKYAPHVPMCRGFQCSRIVTMFLWCFRFCSAVNFPQMFSYLLKFSRALRCKRIVLCYCSKDGSNSKHPVEGASYSYTGWFR